MDRFMHLGASMYLFGVWCKVVNFWGHHPKWVAKTVVDANDGSVVMEDDFAKQCKRGKLDMYSVVAQIGSYFHLFI